jgi:hypothetical protein
MKQKIQSKNPKLKKLFIHRIIKACPVIYQHAIWLAALSI